MLPNNYLTLSILLSPAIPASLQRSLDLISVSPGSPIIIWIFFYQDAAPKIIVKLCEIHKLFSPLITKETILVFMIKILQRDNFMQ